MPAIPESGSISYALDSITHTEHTETTDTYHIIVTIKHVQMKYEIFVKLVKQGEGQADSFEVLGGGYQLPEGELQVQYEEYLGELDTPLVEHLDQLVKTYIPLGVNFHVERL